MKIEGINIVNLCVFIAFVCFAAGYATGFFSVKIDGSTPDRGAIADIERRTEEIAERERSIIERERFIAERETDLDKRESDVTERERSNQGRQRQLTQSDDERLRRLHELLTEAIEEVEHD